MWDIIGNIIKRSGLGIPDPKKLVARHHGVSTAIFGELVTSLLDVMDLNYVIHRTYVWKAIVKENNYQDREKMVELG